MSDFPRTTIEDISVSRLIIGTNWFLGFSHTSRAKDNHIKATMTREPIADIIEVFLNAGVDTLLGIRPNCVSVDAIEEAEQRTGKRCIRIGTPSLKKTGTAEDRAENERIIDAYADIGVDICMPHQSTTDAYVDRKTASIPGIEPWLKMIRDRGMVPGLSTHMPETPKYADNAGLDAATYIQIYNAAGFLMQIEIDWVNRMIWNAKKPVITIKPLASGKLPVLVGLAFNWSTIREKDMVCIGTNNPDEAREVIELSRALIERRQPTVELQETRSKASLK